MTSRRDFLKLGGLGLGVASGFATNLASFNAFAANTTGYKALVCVFLEGGMDSHDLVIPYDATSSRAYERIRASLIDEYEAAGATSRRRDGLLPLQGTGRKSSAAGTADGRAFAFPQEMRELHDLYRKSNLAIIGNVGPLVEPVTRSTYSAGSALLPARLFSHNDQESVWMASKADGANSGWGGRFGDIMRAANANQYASYTSVSTSGNRVFANGANSRGFTLSANNSEMVLDSRGRTAFAAAYNNNIYGNAALHDNLLVRDLINLTGSTVADNLHVREIFQNAPDPVTEFPKSSLGDQLSAVAKMIANRNVFGMRRQVFIVTDNGYDHHTYQAEKLPGLQAGVSKAMAAFYREMQVLGVEDDVTQFTASEFGRALVPNATGTDHGWGSHHLVLGGSVNGGRFYGNIPEAATAHAQDAGQGRLIPEVSVDEYAYSLGRWFGLGAGEADQVLPNIGNFNRASLEGLLPWS